MDWQSLIIAVGVGYVCWTILTHMDDARGKLEKDIENVRYDMEAGFERMDLATDQAIDRILEKIDSFQTVYENDHPDNDEDDFAPES